MLGILRAETAHWGRDGGGVLCDGPAGFGSALSLNTREAAFERMPVADSNGVMFTAAGRVDNRRELGSALGLEADELSRLADGTLICRAWLRWGDSCPQQIFGDWAFAVWNPHTRRLFLARDRFGITAIYYYANAKFFAFSSSRRALLKLNLPVIEMDELYLAQVVVGWNVDRGDRTIHKQVKRLPPAHDLSVTPERIETRQYWQLENTPELALPRKDYIPAFLEVFDRAVRDRLRSDGLIGAMLSGGLDSGSVAITGAGFLKEAGRRLPAFTSVPVFGSGASTGNFFGDELPFAQATADAAGNIDLTTVDAAGSCPIDAIRRGLLITSEPKNGASNYFWALELRRMAVERGCRVLLTGQAGNMGVSWAGDIFSQPALVQIRELGWRRWLWRSTSRRAPREIREGVRRYRVKKRSWHNTAINPDFAERLGLTARFLDDARKHSTDPPLLKRCSGINPGLSSQGVPQAEMGAAYGLEERDPTGDARVLAFCFAVPERIFIDPKAGLDRWLIRESMKGRLPESVRMNRRRGRQAADLVPRLRSSAAAVDSALAEIEAGPAVAYVSVTAMRKAWETIRTEDTPETFRLAFAVLTRGIAAGLFVNGFGNQW